MSEYHRWRENVVYAHAKLSTIMYLLYELNEQLNTTIGVMSISGVHLDKEKSKCILNAACGIRDLRLHLDNMLDEAERKNEQRTHKRYKFGISE